MNNDEILKLFIERDEGAINALFLVVEQNARDTFFVGHHVHQIMAEEGRHVLPGLQKLSQALGGLPPGGVPVAMGDAAQAMPAFGSRSRIGRAASSVSASAVVSSAICPFGSTCPGRIALR